MNNKTKEIVVISADVMIATQLLLMDLGKWVEKDAKFSRPNNRCDKMVKAIDLHLLALKSEIEEFRKNSAILTEIVNQLNYRKAKLEASNESITEDSSRV